MGRNGPSRVGLRNAGRGPLLATSTIATRGSASHISSVLKTKPHSNCTSRILTGKFVVLEGLLNDKEAWKTKNDSQRNEQELQRKSEDEPTKRVKSTVLSDASKADSSVPEWRRKCPKPEKHLNIAGSRAQNGLLRTPDLCGRTLGSTASRINCTFTRSCDQPRMADTEPVDYRSFRKQEFTLGTIIRATIHEQDFMDTPKSKLFATSAGITNVGKEHVTHGAFGAVYSENRFLIVVNNRPEDHYLAIPVYSHKGNGLAKKIHRDEYVSVADHRYLANCQQQSAHTPLVTEFLKDGVEELFPKSVAYASYPVSRKYGLPVAHQGKLDDESTKRLVSMYIKWGKPYETED